MAAIGTRGYCGCLSTWIGMSRNKPLRDPAFAPVALSAPASFGSVYTVRGARFSTRPSRYRATAGASTVSTTSPGATSAEFTPRGVGTPFRINPPLLQTVANGNTSESKTRAVITSDYS